MKITEILDFIQNNEWVFAKTMPEAPHEYVVKNKLSPFYKTQFERLTKYIRIFGRNERYLGTHPVRQYLYIAGYKYWTMGAPIQSTIIMNRAQVDPNPYDLMQYETLFTSPEDLMEEKELVEYVIQAFQDRPRIKTVLDVGCGDGLFIRHTDYPEDSYVGIDPSVRMLSLFAQNHPSYEESIFLGRAEDARLTARFDLIISLYGSPNYLPFIWPEFFNDRLSAKGLYFLCFFGAGYTPKTYERSGVTADHFFYPKSQLQDNFECVRQWGNYYLCCNF